MYNNFVVIQRRIMVETEVENTQKSELCLAIDCLKNAEFDRAIKVVENEIEKNRNEHSFLNISVATSLYALILYKKDKNNFSNSMKYLEESRFCANYSNSKYAVFVYNLIYNYICSQENYQNNFKEILMQTSISNNKTDFTVKLAEFFDYNLKMPFIADNNYDYNTSLIALINVARAISIETNIDHLLVVIAKQTKDAIDADRCTVFLYDEKTNELWSKVALRLQSEEIRFPANLGLAGHVFTTGETVFIQDAYNDKRFNKEVDLKTGYKTNNLICIPIRNLKHEIIGVFQVLNKLSGEFTKADEELLGAISVTAGISIENANLFEHQQHMIYAQRQLFSSFVDTLATSIDARDKITAGHSFRVKLFASNIAQALNYSSSALSELEQAAILHDIGKIGIRDSVLQKEGKLTDEEYLHIQDHVKITYEILNKIYYTNGFNQIAEIAASHHEKYDGTGYFRKLKGEDIPFGGRILAVADVFDAITSKRHYRDKMPIKQAIEILLNGKNSHFDPKLIDKFMSLSTDKIMDVFLTEGNTVLDDEARRILSKYAFIDLYNLICLDVNILTEEQ